MNRSLPVAMALLAGAGCATYATTPADRTANASRYAVLADALCAAADQMSDGELVAGRATFIDQAHESLHVIAEELETVDRSAAARLLEAKQRVESDLTTLSSASLTDLRRLIARVNDAMPVLQPTPVVCPSQGTVL